MASRPREHRDLIVPSATSSTLAASATLRPQGLDRFWRNARTLASHNPRIYKDRIVGDFASADFARVNTLIASSIRPIATR